MVKLTPVSADAIRLRHEPRVWPASGISLEPSDESLTRTAWWIVRADGAMVRRQLLNHVPAGMRRCGGVGGGSAGIRDVTYEQRKPAKPLAYTGVSLLVQWFQPEGRDPRTFVRADTFTAARAVRNPRSIVGGHVTSVDIKQIHARQEPGPAHLPTVHLTEPSDRFAINRLVVAVNRLPASIRPPPAVSCPAPSRPVPRLALTFHTGRFGADRVVMRLVAWCFGQVQTFRNGHPVRPTLDPRNLVEVVDHIRTHHGRQ